MKNVFSAACLVASVSAFSSPVVTDVRVSQSWAQKPLSVSYSLNGGDAVVTADILTNGVRIAAGDQLSMSGEVNRVVSCDGNLKTFRWYPPRSWWGDGRSLSAGTITARLTAWPTNMPPDYMVIDLDGSKNKEYFTSEDRLPLGIDSDVYRTDKLVMRLIRAKGRPFRFGASHVNERGLDPVERGYIEIARHAMLTKDYYIGVFEFTQGQYHKINGNRPSMFANEECWRTRPVEYLQRSHIIDSNWPNDDPAVANSAGSNRMLYRLRNAVGMDWRLTLPTCAQWEFACRAGSLTSLNDGYSTTWHTNSLGVSEASCRLSRNADNGGLVEESVGTKVYYDATKGTARVGSYEPNAWGLYDMLGNVSELCQDLYIYPSGYGKMSIDPGSHTKDKNNNATVRTTRGGSCRQTSLQCRPSYEAFQQDWLYSTTECVGFRPIYILP